MHLALCNHENIVEIFDKFDLKVANLRKPKWLTSVSQNDQPLYNSNDNAVMTLENNKLFSSTSKIKNKNSNKSVLHLALCNHENIVEIFKDFGLEVSTLRYSKRELSSTQNENSLYNSNDNAVMTFENNKLFSSTSEIKNKNRSDMSSVKYLEMY